MQLVAVVFVVIHYFFLYSDKNYLSQVGDVVSIVKKHWQSCRQYFYYLENKIIMMNKLKIDGDSLNPKFLGIC